uniref:Uncharacterized protein n=1 Tax=Arundo donax TaxID=35708 RepID=A0A0A9H329_ARUDO
MYRTLERRRPIVLSREARARQCRLSAPLNQSSSASRFLLSCAISSRCSTSRDRASCIFT